MQRYFLQEEQEPPFRLYGKDAYHITHVMRMQPGDEVLIVTRSQKSAVCALQTVSPEEVTVKVKKWQEEEVELPVSVTIASGLPKGDKLEWIFQKGTELGAAGFIPFVANRSVVKWDEKKVAKRKDRWDKILKEAAEQSHRVIIPTVQAPCPFQTLLEEMERFDQVIVAYEESAKSGEQSTFSSVITKLQRQERVLCIFGPEGGFTEKEIEALEQKGAHIAALGPRILRTETAPLYALSAISYQLELFKRGEQ